LPPSNGADLGEARLTLLEGWGRTLRCIGFLPSGRKAPRTKRGFLDGGCRRARTDKDGVGGRSGSCAERPKPSRPDLGVASCRIWMARTQEAGERFGAGAVSDSHPLGRRTQRRDLIGKGAPPGPWKFVDPPTGQDIAFHLMGMHRLMGRTSGSDNSLAHAMNISVDVRCGSWPSS